MSIHLIRHKCQNIRIYTDRLLIVAHFFIGICQIIIQIIIHCRSKNSAVRQRFHITVNCFFITGQSCQCDSPCSCDLPLIFSIFQCLIQSSEDLFIFKILYLTDCNRQMIFRLRKTTAGHSQRHQTSQYNPCTSPFYPVHKSPLLLFLYTLAARLLRFIQHLIAGRKDLIEIHFPTAHKHRVPCG